MLRKWPHLDYNCNFQHVSFIFVNMVLVLLLYIIRDKDICTCNVVSIVSIIVVQIVLMLSYDVNLLIMLCIEEVACVLCQGTGAFYN